MDKRNFDLLAMGEIMLRLSPQNDQRIKRGDIFIKQAGGSEFNVVSGASLLGIRTGIISKLPESNISDYIKYWIRYCGVSDNYLVYDHGEDARLGVYYYETGAYPRKPRVEHDRKNSSINKIRLTDFDDSLYRSTKCFHTSGITLALSQQVRSSTVEMIKKFKENGTLISFDVNFRSNLWSSQEARKHIETILPYVDFFFCSEDTAKLTFKKQGDVYSMMKDFASEYPFRVIASTQRIVHSPKSHTFGSIVYDTVNSAFFEEEPYCNIDVIDRLGSGDAYVSGVLYGLLTSELDCEKALQYGNAAGAVKNTIAGDIPSSDLKDIEAIIREHHVKSRREMDR